VVDSGSTDATKAICERLGARVLFNPWPGFGPQKRFAEAQAGNDWIFNLDADEWASDALRAEITQIRRSDPPETRAFRIRTRLVYPGRDAPFRFADCHNYIRLYNRKTTRFRDSLAHDEVAPTADVVQFRGEIWHRSFRSASHIVQKMIAYGDLQRREGKRASGGVARAVYEGPAQFLKYYLLRRHILGGARGFIYAVAFAMGRWLRYARLAGW
jgi:glycosyltransferase involved in cell wall biosynthesis